MRVAALIQLWLVCWLFIPARGHLSIGCSQLYNIVGIQPLILLVLSHTSRANYRREGDMGQIVFIIQLVFFHWPVRNSKMKQQTGKVAVVLNAVCILQLPWGKGHSSCVLYNNNDNSKVSGLQKYIWCCCVFLYDLLLCKRTDNYMVAWGLQQWHHGRADQRCVSVSLGSGLKVLKKLVRIIEASYDYDHHC